MLIKRIVPAFAVIGLLVASPAFANHCPMDMKQIDAALDTAKLSDADKAEVMKLRQDGEAQHNAGDHAASVETLAKAKAILKIE